MDVPPLGAIVACYQVRRSYLLCIPDTWVDPVGGFLGLLNVVVYTQGLLGDVEYPHLY